MNLTDKVLEVLISGSGNYRGLYRRMGENGTRPTGGKIEFSSEINESHLRITLISP